MMQLQGVTKMADADSNQTTNFELTEGETTLARASSLLDSALGTVDMMYTLHAHKRYG